MLIILYYVNTLAFTEKMKMLMFGSKEYARINVYQKSKNKLHQTFKIPNKALFMH